MAINKKLIHFNHKSDFQKLKTATSASDTSADIPYNSIVFIKDTNEIFTHGQVYSCNTKIVRASLDEYNNMAKDNNTIYLVK